MKKNFLNKFGYTLIEVALVASLLGVVPVSLYLEAAKAAKTVSCMSNLRNIYIGLQLYELDYEKLPDAKFYPESPKKDPRSIMNLLSRYIDDNRVYVCIGMPEEIQKVGLNYIWNDSYNNKLFYSIPQKGLQWLMTDMSAVDPRLPPPHRGSYNVVFVDGHVETVRQAVRLSPSPADLKDYIKERYLTSLPKKRPAH